MSVATEPARPRRTDVTHRAPSRSRRSHRSRVPILAIDLPSGLDPDTGEPLGVAIRAACTVTLALPKTGLLAATAAPLVGELVLADIGIPAAAHERPDVDVALLFGRSDLVRIIR